MDPSASAGSRYGSAALDRLAEKLSGTPDARKRYEYVLWLAKKLPPMPEELQTEDRKVQGCVSQVFVDAHLENDVLHWQGASDALITNFHTPQSTLLMTTSAFAGHELTMDAYQEAIKEKYRFFAYGDALLVL